MRKIYLLAACLFGVISANSQSYVGFLTDNYSGVHGVINNPASIADSRFKADINLIGVSALLGNDYFGFNVNDLLDDDYDIEKYSLRHMGEEHLQSMMFLQHELLLLTLLLSKIQIY